MDKIRARLLAATSAACVFAPGLEAAAQQGVNQTEEVVVTANRRAQALQSVGSAVQVMSGAELDRLGAARMADFVLQVPGVSFREQGNGATRVALRGVSNIAAVDSGAGSTVSTVGLYFGEIPIQGTSVLPDLATYDLARVEVLKGPQGTLYGEGAMGGAIRMIPNTVDLEEVSGSAETQISKPEDGDIGWLARGAINVPLIQDKLGLRLVGSYRDEGGYIDNVRTGKENVNSRDGFSIRAVARAAITDRMNLEVLGLYNEEDVEDFNQIDERLGDLQVSTLEDRLNRTQFQLYGATLNYDLDWATLSLVSSHNKFQREFVDRFPLAAGLFSRFGTVTAEPEYFAVDQQTTAHEARLVSSGDNRLDWVLGVFYRDRQSESYITLDLLPADLASVNAGLQAAGFAPFPDQRYAISLINDYYEQFAVYGEGILALSDTVDLTLGLRWFQEDVQFSSQTTSFSILTALNNRNRGEFTEEGSVPKVNLTWRASPDHTLYAQAAQGFRSGGINFQAVLVGGDLSYGSDGLWNYEIGWKGQLFDQRLNTAVSAFYIDWKDIQSNYFVRNTLLNTNVGLVNNGGAAFIQGVELEFTGRPTDSFTLGGSLSFSKSELKEPAPRSDIIPGQSLPNAPRMTASAFAEYRHPIADGMDGLVRFDVQHTAAQRIRFLTRTFNGFPVQSYELVNARAGVETGAWSLQAFVNNVFDERAQFGRGLSLLTSTANPELLTIAKPRTVGLQLRLTY